MADLPTESQQLAIRAAQECKALRTLINGNALDLSSLETTAKTSLVAAINAATLTVVAFATELEDTNSAWDGSAFTVPAGKGGLWEIRGGYVFSSVTDASLYVVTVSVNSTTAGMYMIGRGIAGGTGLCGAGGSVAVPLAAGDVIRMMVFCTNATTGYNSTVGYCTFSAHLLT
jgi:hypothetical protein